MKTAMRILKERLLVDKAIFPELNEYIDGIISDIDSELSEKEKQIIIDAYDEGKEHETNKHQGSISYYNETFKND